MNKYLLLAEDISACLTFIRFMCDFSNSEKRKKFERHFYHMQYIFNFLFNINCNILFLIGIFNKVMLHSLVSLQDEFSAAQLSCHLSMAFQSSEAQFFFSMTSQLNKIHHVNECLPHSVNSWGFSPVGNVFYQSGYESIFTQIYKRLLPQGIKAGRRFPH